MTNTIRLIVLMAFCSATVSALAQKHTKQHILAIHRQVNKYGEKQLFPDSIIRHMQTGKKLLIGYIVYNNARKEMPTVYYLVILQAKKNIAVQYKANRIRTAAGTFFTADTLYPANGAIDSLVALTAQLQPWKIRHADTTDADPCNDQGTNMAPGCSIADAASLSLMLGTGTHTVQSSYYAPEYYEYECCPGDEERKHFLQVIQRIKAVFSKTNPGN